VASASRLVAQDAYERFGRTPVPRDSLMVLATARGLSWPGVNGGLCGGRGDDFILTRDRSADRALCGSGRRDAAVAVVDRRDHVSGCERVNGRRRG
jgi:hypothetical protein